eukprot:scaffold1821_cov344-Pavlova_lutheri.AAC.35
MAQILIPGGTSTCPLTIAGRQLSLITASFRPQALAIWSIAPQGAPTPNTSARWQSLARVRFAVSVLYISPFGWLECGSNQSSCSGQLQRCRTGGALSSGNGAVHHHAQGLPIDGTADF